MVTEFVQVDVEGMWGKTVCSLCRAVLCHQHASFHCITATFTWSYSPTLKMEAIWSF